MVAEEAVFRASAVDSNDKLVVGRKEDPQLFLIWGWLKVHNAFRQLRLDLTPCSWWWPNITGLREEITHMSSMNIIQQEMGVPMNYWSQEYYENDAKLPEVWIRRDLSTIYCNELCLRKNLIYSLRWCPLQTLDKMTVFLCILQWTRSIMGTLQENLKLLYDP